ncbi:two-component system sensor histidine kinase KdpD [Massilia sp. Root335]|uniref:two-component system sensor histidine kinase KdpD n=1 Tax=Massilia sp. Root335 TaxID=1736517 RepID=UPI000700E65C|nr:two-component system sensor histidine kinase KdpD [Massilia sp. Root335]KQV50092.1 sensor protein KdpD [Massilia sp. Root335]
MNFPGDEARRDPDALLAQVREQERRAARGRLRIYFGASAGVGKTYSMLSAARQLAATCDVLIGIVETHGRAETEALLEGLAVLPRKRIDYRGRALVEFDIDAALERRAQLVLIDELAHSNVPGSRHPKRWQDIEELLARGIDVFTTVNVQHLESLNDVVGGITGVRVGETVPDSVFDEADEVVLVDLPADELLARLKLGKVYQPSQAERAGRNFFRKGNLIALRELALRRTAERIGDDVRAYRVEKSIDAVWRTGTALLACVGPGPGAEGVVRSAARLAGQLGAEWHAVYVETPALQRLGAARRERILDALKLARDLGAATAVLSGDRMEDAVVDYARTHNLARIVLGRGHGGRPWRAPASRRVARRAPDIELLEVAAAQSLAADGPRARTDEPRAPGRTAIVAHGAAILSSLCMALAATPTIAWLDLANIAMLFLLVVLLVAVRFGRGPSVTATCVSVACFDFFFVPPRFTFAISDLQYLVTFGVMLAVGLITGHLTAGLRFQAHVAARRESRTRALYEFARALSGVLQTEQIQEATRDAIGRTFGARTALLLPDADGRVRPSAEADAGPIAALDAGIAQWAFDHGASAGMGTDTLPGSPVFYMPLVAPMRTRGVLAIEAATARWLLAPEQRQQLDTFATLAAIALERVHYIEVAQDALLKIESERLRNSLLAALSHDLRTPLTSLMVQAEALAHSAPPLAPAQRTMADALREEMVRMSMLVTNLLDMARIESGDVRLKLQWQPVEEVIGSALAASRAALAGHTVETHVPADLPLVQYDAVLIERVLSNLLENAGKYTPPGSTVAISAERHGVWLDVAVTDDGPGLPPGQEEAVFEKFTRGERESVKPGVGLGLAICRAIVGAHGGTIHAANQPGGGAAFVFTLPLGTPPALPLLDEDIEIEEQDE